MSAHLIGSHCPERSFWVLRNCSFENWQLRTFSLLSLMLTACFLSLAKTWPQCSFNLYSSLKASSLEIKRRKIAVSCLRTLFRFALDSISNNNNNRNDFPSFSQFLGKPSLIPCSYTIAQQNQGQRIGVYPKSQDPAL